MNESLAFKILATEWQGNERLAAAQYVELEVLKISCYGDPDKSLQDWIYGGDYDGNETIFETAREWDSGR